MKAYASYAEWKKDQSAKSRKIIGALQRLVEATAPHLTMTVKWGQGCFTDGDAPKVYLHCEPDHVQLGFYRGATLDDPDGLLAGSGKYVRHVKIRSTAEIQERTLGALIRKAVRARDEG
jgi:hypothetical protein